MLHGKHLACTGKSALHLIRDEKDAVFVANGAKLAHEIARRIVKTTLALNRLDNDRRNP